MDLAAVAVAAAAGRTSETQMVKSLDIDTLRHLLLSTVEEEQEGCKAGTCRHVAGLGFGERVEVIQRCGKGWPKVKWSGKGKKGCRTACWMAPGECSMGVRR